MNQKKRMANLELLRCAAMMMVIVLHYLGKGGLLADLTGESLGSVGAVAWLLEAFSIAAVNVYMFISGYFLCTSSFKLSRLLQLWLQVWFYSVAFGLIGALTGAVTNTAVDTHYFLTLLFPVTMGHYWFMTAYVLLYLLLPLIGLAVKKLTKEQMQVTLVSLLVVFSVVKSVIPARLEMDAQGYDCLWYLCVFLAAAYVRRFGMPFLEKRGRGLLLYLGASLLIFGATIGLRQIYLRTGSLGLILKVCMEYNHILPFLAAVGLFAAFTRVNLDGRAANAVLHMAPHTLGIYLLHENIGFRYSWQSWLGAQRVSGTGSLLLWTAAAVLAVFLCGILVDMLRVGLMRVIQTILRRIPAWRKLTLKISHVDGLFTEENRVEE